MDELRGPSSRVKRYLSRLPRYGWPWLLVHWLRGGTQRSEALLVLHRTDGLFQPDGTTSYDRYPGIFRFLRQRIADGPDRRLLSFGCSTGQEVLSLRRRFPRAFIKGIDINTRSIAACWAKLAPQDRGRTAFIAAGSAVDEDSEFYDAVLAMSVLRHSDLGKGPPHCDRLLTFAQFDRAVTALARCVKPGGYLVIRNANFRFGDTQAALGFQLVLQRRSSVRTPLYDRNDCLAPTPTHEDTVFIKSPIASDRAIG